MKDRIKGLLTRKKLFRFFKIAVIVIFTSVVFLSLCLLYTSSIAGATYGVYSDKDCTKQLATLTTDNSGNTDTVEVKTGTVYIKELSAPAGYKVDNTVYSLNVEAGKTATLNVSDTPKVTD